MPADNSLEGLVQHSILDGGKIIPHVLSKRIQNDCGDEAPRKLRTWIQLRLSKPNRTVCSMMEHYPDSVLVELVGGWSV